MIFWKYFNIYLGPVATTLQMLRWNVRFTTNGMYTKKNTKYAWREQAIIEWSRCVISVVVCCHSAKLCVLATWAFRSQQNGAVTRMWRLCWVQPSHKERAIGAVHCKKEGMLLQPLRWGCAGMRGSPRMECVLTKTLYMRGTNKQ